MSRDGSRSKSHPLRITNAEAVSVAGLTKWVVESTNFDVGGLVFWPVEVSHLVGPVIKADLNRFPTYKTTIPDGLKMDEARIELSRSYEGHQTRFSMLHSADVLLKPDAANYWLERISTRQRPLSLCH